MIIIPGYNSAPKLKWFCPGCGTKNVTYTGFLEKKTVVSMKCCNCQNRTAATWYPNGKTYFPEKRVLVRKTRKCEMCGRSIQRGEHAIVCSYRTPTYTESIDFPGEDIQIGINYQRIYHCTPGSCDPPIYP